MSYDSCSDTSFTDTSSETYSHLISDSYTETTSSISSHLSDDEMNCILKLPPLVKPEDLKSQTGYAYWSRCFYAGILQRSLSDHITNAICFSCRFLKGISWMDLTTVNENMHPEFNLLSFLIGPSIDEFACEIFESIAHGYHYWKILRTKESQHFEPQPDVMGIEAAVEPSYFPLLSAATLIFASDGQPECNLNMNEGG